MLGRLHKRLVLAGKILTGRWSAEVSTRQAQLEAALARVPSPLDSQMEAAGLPKDLEAVLVHSALAAMEVERLTMLYASLASRIASLEQALKDTKGTMGSPGHEQPY